jgi:drug/metabolite transporter (DMT)-like permease
MGAVLFLGTFGSAFAFVTLYHLMRTMAASRLSLIAFVTPIVAAILGWLILGEMPTWATAAGAILVLAGIWVVNVLAPRTTPGTPGVSAVEALDIIETEGSRRGRGR